MDEIKGKLKIEVLKELPEQLVKEKIVDENRWLIVNKEGKITLSSRSLAQDQTAIDAITNIINFLASEYANAKVDQLSKESQLTKKD